MPKREESAGGIAIRDAPIVPSMEVYYDLGMGRRSRDAAMKDAPTTPSMHESAGDMGRSARNAAMKDALKIHKGE